MKKQNIVFLASLTLAGCVSTATKIQNAQTFATGLENKKDILQTLAVYNKTFGPCFKLTEKWNDDNTKREYSKIAWGAVCDKISINALVKPDVNLGCVIEEWDTKDYYNSDECIVNRRTAYDSKIGYFDYKRFLPTNTKINTEDDFLGLVKYYATRYNCEKLVDATTYEKQDCENKIIETTRQMATTGVKCMNAYPKEYKEFLNDKGSWYGWAIDHDPWETKKMVYYTGGAAAAYWIPEEPVYSKSEALKSITQSVAEWGQRHICDTTGWQAEIRKMGYKLN